MARILAQLQVGEPTAIALFVAIFSVLALLYSLVYQYRVWHWPAVWGTLGKAGIKAVGGGAPSEREHMAEVEYCYSVGGVEYTGHRLSAMQATASGVATALLAQQLKGVEYRDGEVKIYHHPTRPEKSFLIRGSTTQLASTIAFLVGALWVASVCLQRLS